MTKNNAPDTMIAILAIVVSGALLGAIYCAADKGLKGPSHCD